jgi:hypothetical protein
MTRQEQLDRIRAACIDANPEIAKREELYHPQGMGASKPISIFGTIRLGDLLLVIGNSKKRHSVTIDAQRDNLVFFWATKDPDNPDRATLLRSQWNLRKDDLTEQSDECVAFLANLLG